MWHLKHARPQAVLLSNPHNYYSAIAQRVLHLTAARPLPSPKSEKNASRLEPFPMRIHMKPEQKTSPSNVSNDPLQQPGAFQRPLVATRVPPKSAACVESISVVYTLQNTPYPFIHMLIYTSCLFTDATNLHYCQYRTRYTRVSNADNCVVSSACVLIRSWPHVHSSSSDTCSPLLACLSGLNMTVRCRRVILRIGYGSTHGAESRDAYFMHIRSRYSSTAVLTSDAQMVWYPASLSCQQSSISSKHSSDLRSTCTTDTACTSSPFGRKK